MIKNLNPNMTTAELRQRIAAGAKFVYFEYTISIVLATFKRPTSIYFVDAHENTAKYNWHLSTLTALLGWWGFPWGPIYTIGTFVTNFGGGKDVTSEVMGKLLANEHLNTTNNSQTATTAYGINQQTGAGNNNASQNASTSSGAGQYNIPR